MNDSAASRPLHSEFGLRQADPLDRPRKEAIERIARLEEHREFDARRAAVDGEDWADIFQSWLGYLAA